MDSYVGYREPNVVQFGLCFLEAESVVELSQGLYLFCENDSYVV